MAMKVNTHLKPWGTRHLAGRWPYRKKWVYLSGIGVKRIHKNGIKDIHTVIFDRSGRQLATMIYDCHSIAIGGGYKPEIILPFFVRLNRSMWPLSAVSNGEETIQVLLQTKGGKHGHKAQEKG